jgi:hypothetical protein
VLSAMALTVRSTRGEVLPPRPLPVPPLIRVNSRTDMVRRRSPASVWQTDRSSPPSGGTNVVVLLELKRRGPSRVKPIEGVCAVYSLHSLCDKIPAPV